MGQLIYPGAVEEEEDLFGRTEVLEEAVKTLSRPNVPFLILGERRIGKTSLQNVIISRLRKSPDSSFVPLVVSPYGKTSFNEFACAILLKVAEATGQWMANIYEKIAQVGSVEQFEKHFRELVKPETKSVFLLCVDEFDEILRVTKPDKSVAGLVHFVSEQGDLPLRILLTMTGVPENIQNQVSSPFLSICYIRSLNLLDQTNANRMVKSVTSDRLLLTEESLDWLYGQFGGHPYFTKWFLSYIIQSVVHDRKQDDQPVLVDIPMLQAVLSRAIRDVNMEQAIKNIYFAQLSDQEKELFLALADREDPLSVAQLNTAGAAYLTAARFLTKREYLHEDQKGFCFKMQFLKSWLCHWDERNEQNEHFHLLRDSLTEPIEVVVDLTTRAVHVIGEEIKLTPIQFDILSTLAEHNGKLVTREYLVDAVWNSPNGVSEETVDTNISRLRRIIHDTGKYIETVHGQGFILRRSVLVSQKNTRPGIRGLSDK